MAAPGAIEMFARMQWRIAVPYTVLIGLCLLGLGAYLATVLRQLQLDQLRAQLAAESRLVAEVIAPVLGGPDAGARIAPLARRLGEQIGARVTIVDTAGAVLGDSAQDPRLMDNHAARPEIVAALTAGDGIEVRHSATLDRDL